MKVRTGFVSNSSTSSFICDICGEVEAGYDLSLSDVNMHQCVAGHVWHDGCAKYKEPDEEDIFKCAVGWSNNEHNQKWYPSELCPFCRLERVSNDDVNSYTRKLAGIETFVDGAKLVMEKFASYEEFQKWLVE